MSRLIRLLLYSMLHRAALLIDYCTVGQIYMYCSDSDCACEICYSKLDSSQLLQEETATDVVL